MELPRRRAKKGRGAGPRSGLVSLGRSRATPVYNPWLHGPPRQAGLTPPTPVLCHSTPGVDAAGPWRSPD
ncbi:hypothetical protein NDU88_000456 [Pleurodeles waltl]|uniref:Uncharacterized protein n=1 Tax=Pleurodeles waltl TaxID=8319 RepID=A0AAV7NCS4_PLEWA|nr:hypothetical protein NDU88_000456 [Pleurodeles waltl]